MAETLILFDEDRQNAKQVVTDENGNYVFSKVKCGKNYFIKTSKSDYEIKEVPLFIISDSRARNSVLKCHGRTK